ncbi:SNF2 family helicase/ATPase, putative [Talaromyces stipitatus ATCC 10500]|uniref:SNF2 family helicase/ATPase, putative n=1 Tax=Talaromyces stipitatus (strain ATCC 10500 / CBS 375.48 / QM 6759 / NRRL 1006) TaxID=441959 RepID=B8MRN3_TALSN|nr:SNF2 family helicase/ATPase, putative [Talaromyces stipitatus ATCC 10500]EED13190.1 SNF2 family helicase/ATPase, putative [Talaromyces stipitatus ATCC 10500]
MASRAAMLLDPRSYKKKMASGAPQQHTQPKASVSWSPAHGKNTKMGSTILTTPPQTLATQSNPDTMSRRHDDVEPESNPAQEPTGEIQFQFISSEDLSSEEDEGTNKKRNRESKDLTGERKSLIEDIYNVERREDQPKKRIKTVDTEDATAKSKAQFNMSGSSGLGEYMKEGKQTSESATAVVDLTSEAPVKSTSTDDEIEVTGSVDLSEQIVCYGKIQNATIQAHQVPRPSRNNFFGDYSRDWPPIKLTTRHTPGRSNRIDVSDPFGRVFGTVDARTAAAIVPLLDTQSLKITMTARLELRRRLDGEEVWQPCSTQYRAAINLIGPRKYAEMVGKTLGHANVWLDTPSLVDRGMPVFNPHAKLRHAQLNYGPAAGSRSRDTVTYEVRTAEEVNDAVMKMFDQLKSAENIPEMEPSPLIRTPLLHHQKQALWFMMEKEQDRKYGSKEEDNNSLWRVVYGPNGDKRYREIISGITLNEEPPQIYGGLLADMMGLGKTLSILSLVVATLPQSRIWEKEPPHNALVRGIPGIRNTKTTLLVSPLSAVHNWVAQIKEHLEENAISYYVFHGPSRSKVVEDLSQYDLIITTYSTISSELRGRGTKPVNSPLIKMNMFRIVLDEAHVIREQSAQQSQAIFRLNGQRRWSVTGTPVQNRLEDLGSVTKFLRLYPYDDRSKFHAHILSRFKLGDPTVFASLRVLVDSFTLRRVKDKIDLPPRQDKIIMLDFSEKEAKLHEYFRKESDVMMKVIANESKSTMGGRMYHHVLKAMMILRQISAHGKELLDKENRERLKGMSVQDAIDLEEGETDDQAWAIEKKAYEMFTLMEESSAAMCAMCNKPLAENNIEGGTPNPKSPMAVMLPCFDVLCLDCFGPLKNGFVMQPESSPEQTRCMKCEGWIPMTYSAITPAGLEQYTESQAEAKTSRKRAKILGEYEGPHTKTFALLEHLHSTAEESSRLKDEPPIKSVIFSGWTSHLDLIEIALKDHGLNGFTRIDGTMSLAARKAALNSFAEDKDITILLATIGAGGVGLNLTSASRVYIMEPQYNPAAVAQAVDRVHRLGQTREVTTVQFIMKASIEEKIFEMAKKKQQLAEDSMARGKLDKREVQEARMQAYRSLFR